MSEKVVNTNVLVVGNGTEGLRTAIECKKHEVDIPFGREDGG